MKIKMSLFKHLQVLFLLPWLSCLLINGVAANHHVKCIESERLSLLEFKKGISYGHYSILNSSGRSKDCCSSWSGVHCSNLTGHVIILDLQAEALSGKISPHLGNLTHLHFLDLSSNYYGLEVDNLDWLSGMSLLKHLDLSMVDLSKVSNWVEVITTQLPLLTDLTLRFCSLYNVLPPSASHLFSNSTTTPPSLATLDLSHNYLDSTCIYPWLFNLSSNLIHLDLTMSALLGSIPNAFGNMINLQYLDLSSTNLVGKIPITFANFSKLQVLKLLHNTLTGSLPDFSFASSLIEFDLSMNRFSGSVSRSFGRHPHLEILNLSGNKLMGSLPHLSSFTSLKVLHLSDNHFDGMLSQANFSNLLNLQSLDLSRNSLKLEFSLDWVPPFQLRKIGVGGCKLGPHFPKWLQSQNNYSKIDLSNNEISDSVPNWFWNASPKLLLLNLSTNNFYGVLPDLSSKFIDGAIIDLSYNSFKGPITLLPKNVTFLNLSVNVFNGSINWLCYFTDYIEILDLSDNLFSGKFPKCWMNMQILKVLNLANNNIFGKIPASLFHSQQLETLQLRNNSFNGELPSLSKTYEYLTFIDVSINRLSGTIPKGICRLKNLKFLSLRSNQFYGGIPSCVCSLQRIQFLDLSLNNIHGTIPNCLDNFTAMVQQSSQELTSLLNPSSSTIFGLQNDGRYSNTGYLAWKGSEVTYKSILGLVKGIDLSSNKLSGEIPKEIVDLVGMVTLNLSKNSLSGGIPLNIGQLSSLNVLDFSNNQLSGGIPTSLSKIDGLGFLNLSDNRLLGRIPFSSHFQTFDASSYMENPGLCGKPLELCPEDIMDQDPHTNAHIQEEDQDILLTSGLYVSLGLGFVTGFWGICGSLLLKSSWRHAFFEMLTEIEDWFFVIFAVYTTKLKRKIRGLFVSWV